MSEEAPLLVVRDDDPTPPFEQVRRQLAALVASGALAPDQRLPPVRQLAADLGLAVGTVARAYRELEEAGAVTTRRGAGTRVAATDAATGAALSAAAGPDAEHEALPDVIQDTSTRDRLSVMVDDLVARAHEMGVRDAEIAAAVQNTLRRAAPAAARPPARPAAARPAPSRRTASAVPLWRPRPVG